MTRLISTKLAVQARTDRIVRRPRLCDSIDAARDVRLILVSAPAGFGKSTLLADWIARSRVRAAWLALDPGDDDLARFVRYLEAACLTLRPGVGPGPDETAAPDAELALTRIVDSLQACHDPVVLVLDDYQAIASQPVHGLVSALLDRLPPNTRLAIATRADPPLQLSRLRARDELLEIRAGDLRFSADEVLELFSLQVDGRLDAEAVDILTRRTEGWAAVLQLAAVSLRGRTDRDRLVREFGASHRYVLDFVTDEVLAGIDPSVRAFLLETSVLDRMCGPACDAVTGTTGGAETLEALERANLLLVPLDDERRWYRYHHLFQDVLRSRLAAGSPDRAVALHRRAAVWHELAGYTDEAIGHSLAGNDVEGARRLVRRHWLGWLHSGETWTVQRWLDAFPPGVVAADPQLCAVYAWSLVLRGERSGVSGWIDAASVALEAGDADAFDRATLPTQLACLRANLSQLEGDSAAALAHARAAVALVPEPDPSIVPPAVRDLLDGDATLLVAHGLVATGKPSDAIPAFRRALPLLHRGGNVIASSHAVLALAALEIRAGRPIDALELAEDALRENLNPSAAYDEIEPERAGAETADAAASERPALAAVHVARAEALIALSRLDEARTELARAVELGRRGEGLALKLAADARGRLARAEAAAGRRRHGGALVEPLTERELEVLRLVALGRSNREIASELFLAVGTVKAHIHTICGKLGAENRVQAINRGRDAGLLD